MAESITAQSLFNAISAVGGRKLGVGKLLDLLTQDVTKAVFAGSWDKAGFSKTSPEVTLRAKVFARLDGLKIVDPTVQARVEEVKQSLVALTKAPVEAPLVEEAPEVEEVSAPTADLREPNIPAIKDNLTSLATFVGRFEAGEEIDFNFLLQKQAALSAEIGLLPRTQEEKAPLYKELSELTLSIIGIAEMITATSPKAPSAFDIKLEKAKEAAANMIAKPFNPWGPDCFEKAMDEAKVELDKLPAEELTEAQAKFMELVEQTSKELSALFMELVEQTSKELSALTSHEPPAPIRVPDAAPGDDASEADPEFVASPKA